MFSDPQSVTINAIANSLPRVSQEGQVSIYRKDDETVQLTISHEATKAGKVRHLVRVDFNKISADVFIPAENRTQKGATYLVIEEPAGGGYTNAEILLQVKGLVGWASDANLTKVIAGES